MLLGWRAPLDRRTEESRHHPPGHVEPQLPKDQSSVLLISNLYSSRDPRPNPLKITTWPAKCWCTNIATQSWIYYMK